MLIVIFSLLSTWGMAISARLHHPATIFSPSMWMVSSASSVDRLPQHTFT